MTGRTPNRPIATSDDQQQQAWLITDNEGNPFTVVYVDLEDNQSSWMGFPSSPSQSSEESSAVKPASPSRYPSHGYAHRSSRDEKYWSSWTSTNRPGQSGWVYVSAADKQHNRTIQSRTRPQATENRGRSWTKRPRRRKRRKKGKLYQWPR